MEIVRCSNGHFYDSEAYRTCPCCEQEKNGGSGKSIEFIGTEALNTGRDFGNGIMKTVDFKTDDSWQKTEDADSVKRKAYPKTTFSRDTEIPRTIFVRQDDTAKTNMGKDPIRPVVGWLVCVQGPTKGKDYRIVDQNNYIGRNADMEISIPEDSSISADRSAVIAYDYHSRGFYFGLVAGHNMVSINDRIVFNPEKIKAYDVLGIGNSKFVFVPLCGEQFEWNA